MRQHCWSYVNTVQHIRTYRITRSNEHKAVSILILVFCCTTTITHYEFSCVLPFGRSALVTSMPLSLDGSFCGESLALGVGIYFVDIQYEHVSEPVND